MKNGKPNPSKQLWVVSLAGQYHPIIYPQLVDDELVIRRGVREVDVTDTREALQYGLIDTILSGADSEGLHEGRHKK